MTTRIHWAGDQGFPRRSFHTGVSLHSHTLHSRESLSFIQNVSRHSALLRWVLRQGRARYFAIHGRELDLNRGWWTPPLAPLDAFALESAQIEAMGLRPLVSLTDHDDIEAPMSLQAVEATRNIPVSVEWTVPYGGTFVHLGIHNLAPAQARSTMGRLAAFTANPVEGQLTEILAGLASDPATLIVFNHPLWDEKGIGEAQHRQAALELLRTHGAYLHALEVNGLRPWHENAATLRLGRECGKPVVSGGDRHTLEPNATLNLTKASTFEEFAGEIRNGAPSEVLIMPQYQMPYTSRVFHNMLDVFRTYENHGHGWKEWGDRVFYTLDDGRVASLASMWGDRPPATVAIFAGFMRFAGHEPVRQALRSLTPAMPAVVE